MHGYFTFTRRFFTGTVFTLYILGPSHAGLVFVYVFYSELCRLVVAILYLLKIAGLRDKYYDVSLF